MDDIPVARLLADGSDLLRALACGFNLQVARANRATVMTTLVRYLANRQREGRVPVVVIDDAQDLDPGALQELWCLGNPRSRTAPVLRLVLAGSDALLDALQTPQLAALGQAVGAVGELRPLDAPQTRAYIAHRLGCSGWRGSPSLSAGALRCIHLLGAGQPAQINLIMARLLQYGANLGLTALHRTDVERIGALLVEAGRLAEPAPRSACALGLSPVGPALRPLDVAVAAEFVAVTAAPSDNAAAPQAPVTPVAALAGGLHDDLSSWRERIAAAALRRRLGLVALIGMTIATSALGTGSPLDVRSPTDPAGRYGVAPTAATVPAIPR
jgi:hypothetical protein